MWSSWFGGGGGSGGGYYDDEDDKYHPRSKQRSGPRHNRDSRQGGYADDFDTYNDGYDYDENVYSYANNSKSNNGGSSGRRHPSSARNGTARSSATSYGPYSLFSRFASPTVPDAYVYEDELVDDIETDSKYSGKKPNNRGGAGTRPMHRQGSLGNLSSRSSGGSSFSLAMVLPAAICACCLFIVSVALVVGHLRTGALLACKEEVAALQQAQAKLLTLSSDANAVNMTESMAQTAQMKEQLAELVLKTQKLEKDSSEKTKYIETMNSKMLATEKDNKKLKLALKQAQEMLSPEQVASFHEARNAGPSYKSFGGNAGGE